MEFLLDPEDTIHSYEEQGKSSQSATTQYDQGMSALGRLDHVNQVEAIHGECGSVGQVTVSTATPS